MSKVVQRRRGTTTQHASFVGAAGEITVDTTKNTVVVHNGSTTGGFPLVKEATLSASGGAATIGFNPTGTIASTNVQAAIAELDADVTAISGTTTAAAVAAVNAQLAASNGSTYIGHIATGTGAVARTAQSKLRDVVTPLDFGAVGDGSTDDSAAFYAALVASQGKNLDGLGKTYKINTQYNASGSGYHLRNMTLDYSSAPNFAIGTAETLLTFNGVQGTAVTLAANTAVGSATVTVGTNGTATFAANQYVYIGSNEVFTSGTTVGQIAKIKTVDSGTQLTLYNPVLYAYKTANTASISPLTVASDILLQDVKFVGAKANQQCALTFNYCENVRVDSCTFDNFDAAGVQIVRCINSSVANSSFRTIQGTGAGGVYVLNASSNVNVTGNYFEASTRGVVSTSGTGVNTYININNNVMAGVSEYPIFFHGSNDFANIVGNTIESPNAYTSFQDGIAVFGLNAIISKNIIVGTHRYGIIVGPTGGVGSASYVVSGNQLRSISNTSNTDIGIYLYNTATIPVDSCVIADNLIDGAEEIHIHITASSANIRNLSITGNMTNDNAASYALILQAVSTNTITDFVIQGNSFKSANTYSNVYILGNSSGRISDGVISNNIIRGGAFGIGLDYTDRIIVDSNSIVGFVTKAVSVSANNTRPFIDRRGETIRYLTSATAYVIQENDDVIVSNFNGTTNVTLPDATKWDGRELTFTVIYNSSIMVTNGNVVRTVGNATLYNYVIASRWYTSKIKSDGAVWQVIFLGYI
jgi:hypothetical protein